MSVFARFPPRLQQAIAARLGWTALRPVQELAGEAILDGKNAVVLAPTAGGKTEAAMFPVLANLVDVPSSAESVRAIYIAPIKALLNNQADRLGLYTEMVGLERFLWHGDVGASDRKRFLREPTDLLMTTPESLEVMLVSPKVAVAELFSDLRFVIIDEVHAMAGADRGAHLMSVLERIARFTTNDVQRIGLSATVGNPDAILAWLRGTSKREAVVIDPPRPPAARKLLVHLDASVGQLADRAAEKAKGNKSLFFF